MVRGGRVYFQARRLLYVSPLADAIVTSIAHEVTSSFQTPGSSATRVRSWAATSLAFALRVPRERVSLRVDTTVTASTLIALVPWFERNTLTVYGSPALTLAGITSNSIRPGTSGARFSSTPEASNPRRSLLTAFRLSTTVSPGTNARIRGGGSGEVTGCGEVSGDGRGFGD